MSLGYSYMVLTEFQTGIPPDFHKKYIVSPDFFCKKPIISPDHFYKKTIILKKNLLFPLTFKSRITLYAS